MTRELTSPYRRLAATLPNDFPASVWVRQFVPEQTIEIDEVIGLMPAVYRFALRLTAGNVHLAEELLQETMLTAVGKLGQLHSHQRLRSWLLSIAANTWKDQLRRSAFQREKTGAEPNDLEQSYTADTTRIESQELIDVALLAMDKLPERQRTVMYLHACEQMDLSEISEVLQISKAAAKASLYVARTRIAQMVGAKNIR